jgi:DNA-binding response OmpR family regulator
VAQTIPGVRRVIVLDRDFSAAFKLVHLLSAEGFMAPLATDPMTALAWVREEEPDLLLVEVGLQVLDVVAQWERRRGDPQPAQLPPPVSEGYAVLSPISSDPGAARYITVVLAGSRELPVRESAPRFALLGYVAKPVTASTVFPKLQSLVRSARFSSRRRSPLVRPATETREGEEVLELDTDPLSDWGEEPFSSLPRPLRKALLLDTDIGHHAFLQDLLEGYGFTVHESTDCAEALSIALQKRPWIIITDALMPAGDGFEFCRAVRSHSLLARTPVFFVSAWDGLQERYRALRLGADDYISKRAPTRELLIRLQLLLKRYSDLGGPGRVGAGLAGGIDVVGAPGLLQMCHLSRLTGVLTARDQGRVATVNFRHGEIVAAVSRRLKDGEAIYDLITWTGGQFEFQAQDPGSGPPLPESFDRLLLEGCRLLDEAMARPKRNLRITTRGLTRLRDVTPQS